MTRDEWKRMVLDAVDLYTSIQMRGGDGRQSAWDRIKRLLDKVPE